MRTEEQRVVVYGSTKSIVFLVKALVSSIIVCKTKTWPVLWVTFSAMN